MFSLRIFRYSGLSVSLLWKASWELKVARKFSLNQFHGEEKKAKRTVDLIIGLLFMKNGIGRMEID